MDNQKLHTILQLGESIAVEFKRCGNGIENDVYETVCSFLNRFGGDIFLGVLDDGTVKGVPENAAKDMTKNFIKMISNPEVLSPTVYLSPEILKYEGKTVIHVHVPVSAEVHTCKKHVYDRVDDADVKVTATAAIASMYIRKQNIFTEKRIYPYVTMEDLRLDLLPKIRRMAENNIEGTHVWQNMSDKELLKSAGLFGVDRATGEKGYNLAAVMLLGKDEVIKDICPAYETDALLRRVNTDRYDDREMVGNILMHREYSSSYIAKLVIEENRMYSENANRAAQDGFLTPDNIEPNPKNPIIASFFRTIGWSDRLGSGVRNLFKYTKFYSGADPEFHEGDVFRLIVPLDDGYSYDLLIGEETGSAIKVGDKKPAIKTGDKKTSATEKRIEVILNIMEDGQEYKADEIAKIVGLKSSRTRELLKILVDDDKLGIVGNKKNRRYFVKK